MEKTQISEQLQRISKQAENDLTQALLNIENIRSFKAHWKSKEVVLKFDNRVEMCQFVNFLDLVYAISEDILEEDEKDEAKENNPEEE